MLQLLYLEKEVLFPLTTGWKSITAVSTENARLRTIVAVIIDRLKDAGKLSSSKSHIFKNEFYNFLRKITAEGLAHPDDISSVVMQFPDLAFEIQYKKFDKFLSAIHQVARTEQSQEILFATLIYDNYYRSRDVEKAEYHAINNSLSQFSPEFVYNIFKRYPYLRDPAHLNYVAGLLDQVSFAYNLTQNGVKEKYDVEAKH